MNRIGRTVAVAAVVAGFITVDGCASLKLAPSPSAVPSAELERGFAIQRGPAEVQFVMAATPDQIIPRLTTAFAAETLVVTSSQAGLIEAKLPADNEIG